MSLLEYIASLLWRRSKLDVEIARHELALKRHARVVDELDRRFFDEGWGCCPFCAFSPTYRLAVEKRARCAATLARLLLKRAAPRDAERAEYLRAEHVR